MEYKTDIEIAQEAKPAKITEVADRINVNADSLELYGNYKAKISSDVMKKTVAEGGVADAPDGKLILVTAITPTPRSKSIMSKSVPMSQ